jgi:hypothetical protein
MTTLVPITEAAKLFPSRKGKALHLNSIRRRILYGCRGVKLKAVRDGHAWFTCQQWVNDFQQAVTHKSLGGGRVDGLDQREFREASRWFEQRRALRGKGQAATKTKVPRVQQGKTLPPGSLSEVLPEGVAIRRLG